VFIPAAKLFAVGFFIFGPMATSKGPQRYPFEGRIAGCDEAGRGCLAGPVCAAAVILPDDFYHPLLNDSKQLSEQKRDLLRPIIEAEAIEWVVRFSTPKEIDQHNILWASVLTMHKCLDGLKSSPDLILVDGNRFLPYKDIQHQCIVKGDSRCLSIAAASVLAKTHRDEAMSELDKKFPHYQWKSNKGYPTKSHREAIRLHGPCKEHRKSFKLV
jgi:ribonuclease HII